MMDPTNPFAVDIIFAGGTFRAKSKFAKIAKMYSTRIIGVIQYTIIILKSGWRPSQTALR